MTDSDSKVLNDLLVNVFNTILKIEDAHLKANCDDGLSMTEIHTLEGIGTKGSKTMTQAAKELMISVGTLTICIGRLVQGGYVLRFKPEEDRRVVRVRLSDKGKAALVEHDLFHKKMVEQVIESLGSEETEILIHSMENLKGFFKQKHDELFS